MPPEQLKFRPNIPEEIIQKQLAILEKAKERIHTGEVEGEIDHNIEYFLVRVRLKDGQKITECLPKNAPEIFLNNKATEGVSLEDAVEAVQRFYSGLDKPSLGEAVKKLREYRKQKQ